MKVGRCSPSEANERVGKDDIAVVVDALRASVTVITLLDCGAKAVEPVSEVPKDRDEERVYVGEDHGERIDGFDFGNSPLELIDSRSQVRNKHVVLRTTNGTRAVKVVEDAGYVIMGSLTNLDAVIRACENLSESEGAVWFVPAGRHGEPAPEDDYTVLRYIEELSERNENTDESRGMTGSEILDSNRRSLFSESDTGEFLRDRGKSRDVSFCSQTNIFDVVPLLNHGVFINAGI